MSLSSSWVGMAMARSEGTSTNAAGMVGPDNGGRGQRVLWAWGSAELRAIQGSCLLGKGPYGKNATRGSLSSGNQGYPGKYEHLALLGADCCACKPVSPAFHSSHLLIQYLIHLQSVQICKLTLIGFRQRGKSLINKMQHLPNGSAASGKTCPANTQPLPPCKSDLVGITEFSECQEPPRRQAHLYNSAFQEGS